MDEIKHLLSGFLGDEPGNSVNELQQVFNDHIFPFIKDWWDPEGPIPSDTEIEQLGKIIERRVQEHPLPELYKHVPELLKRISNAIRFNRRNYVNIHPSPFIPSTLASFIISVQNPNNIVEEVSKPTWQMEKESIEWMAENLFAIDADAGRWGNVVSGGTVANMTALLIARDYIYDKLNRPRPRSVGSRGLIGYEPGVVIGTTATHYSVRKALWFLGIGSENLITIPVAIDEKLRQTSFKDDRFIKGIQNKFWKQTILSAIDLDNKQRGNELEKFYCGEPEPFSLQPLNSELLKTVYSCFQFNTPLIGCVLTLGTTDTGTLEKLDDEVIKLLKEEDIFMHADAASGGFSMVLDEVRDQANDLSLFDSFTIDAHKMGLLHYPCGAVLFKDKGFREQIRHEAPYLGELAPTLEGSRTGANSAALWMATKTIDVAGYQQFIKRLLIFTDHLRKAFVDTPFQVLHKVQLNAIVVAPKLHGAETRLEVNKLVELVRADILTQGEFMVNLDKGVAGIKVRNVPSDDKSELVDIYALRIVITNPLVEDKDAAGLVAQLVKSLQRIRGGSSSFKNDLALSSQKIKTWSI